MAEALPFVSISALIVGVATLVMAALAFRHARRSAGLAEDRMEYLREEQARLEFLHEERRSMAEELKREREQRLESQQRPEHTDQKHLRELEEEHRRSIEELEQELERERGQRLEAQRRAELERQERLLVEREREQLVEGLEQERTKRLEAQRKAGQEREGWERERSAHQQTEQRADRLERELHELREDQRGSPVSEQEGLSEVSEDPRETRMPLWEKLFPRREAQEEADEWTRQPAGPSESRTLGAAASEPAEGELENEKPKRGRWLPHPDDERDRRNLGKGGGG